jgi:AAA domain-containing protein
MPCEIHTEEDLAKFGDAPKVLSVADLLALDVPAPSMLIQQILPAASATLIVGPSKAGKTLIVTQMGIAVASGKAFCDYYPVLEGGPVLMVEQDDPRGAASVKDILRRSPVSVQDIPFFLVERVPFCFGERFIAWLEPEIKGPNCDCASWTAIPLCEGRVRPVSTS